MEAYSNDGISIAVYRPHQSFLGAQSLAVANGDTGDALRIIYLASAACALSFLLYLPARLWKLQKYSTKITPTSRWLDLGVAVSNSLPALFRLATDQNGPELWNVVISCTTVMPYLHFDFVPGS